MNALRNRALAALVGSLAYLTQLVTVEVGAADVLPSTISQIRTQQLAKVNTISASLYRTPHDYYAVQEEAPVLFTNISFSAGLSPDAVVSKLREVAFQVACLATNFPSANNNATNATFLLIATAKEVGITSIFPQDNVPTTTLEMAGINGIIPILPNGSGGFKLPNTAMADTIPVYLSPYIFLSFPDLKYFDQLPPPPWYFQYYFERKTYARVFTGNPDGSVSEVQSKGWGSSIIDRTQADMSAYGDYEHTDGVKLLRLYGIGRIGIHLSLLTNGTPAVLALEAADGTFPRYWLPTGQPIGNPMVTGVSLVSGKPKVSIVGQPGDLVVLESAGGFGPAVQWTTEVTLPALSQSGIAHYLCPTPVNSVGSSNRFWRIRVIQQAAQSRP
ncbi:MAG: hypothetical protein WCO79_01330 [bacterium]